MKMNMKDISIASCGALAAIVIGINWWGPINAFAGPAQTGSPPVDEVVQDSTTAFQAWNATSTMYAKQMNALFNAYVALKGENAQLKDELARAKAPPPSPAPMSTPGPKP